MRLLVIAPHPDDETLGCGGTLCRHAEAGDHICLVFLTSGELGLKQHPRETAWSIRETEARTAAGILGASELHFLRCSDWMLGEEVSRASGLLKPIVSAQNPDLIYLPHPEEDHPDHQAALRVLRAALRHRRRPPRLRGYEVWTPMNRFDHVQDITRFMSRKLKALRAHQSQLGEFDYVRAVTGLNQFRGVTAARSRFAEVFKDL
jgi:N-acetylglucosamine malate deacetylase 1